MAIATATSLPCVLFLALALGTDRSRLHWHDQCPSPHHPYHALVRTHCHLLPSGSPAQTRMRQTSLLSGYLVDQVGVGGCASLENDIPTWHSLCQMLRSCATEQNTYPIIWVPSSASLAKGCQRRFSIHLALFPVVICTSSAHLAHTNHFCFTGILSGCTFFFVSPSHQTAQVLPSDASVSTDWEEGSL